MGILTNDQLAKIVGQNTVWRTRLNIRGVWPTLENFWDNGIRCHDIEAHEYLQQVADFQKKSNLVVDGVVGPKTAAAIAKVAVLNPDPVEYLLIHDLKVPVTGLDIVSPTDKQGLSFNLDGHSAWTRTEPIKQFVLHVKGAEGSAAGTWAYLKSKRYGVHMSLERDGRIWQYCDLGTAATAHAGLVNETSIGIEITNQMFPVKPNPYSRPILTAPYIVRDPSNPSYGKEINRRILGLLPVQMDAVVKLITAVCDATGIPKVVPGKNGKLWTGLLPGTKVNTVNWKKVRGIITFEGVIGHLHVTNGHSDPSTDIFEALMDSGFSLKEI